MKFIKNAIYKIIRWSQTVDELEKTVAASDYHQSTRLGSNRHGPDMIGMNFTVFNAVGGKVIQINQYNPLNDRSKQSLYIITDKEDLGAELGQIITVESLNR